MTSGNVTHSILKALLRGGGGSEHDRLKVSAWSWLISQGYSVVDFEVGGFDVLGLRKKRDLLSGRVVVDAKTSKSDLYNHFSKGASENCDIDGKFSNYGSQHYIICRRGLFTVDAVHDPWGLLECDGSSVSVRKEACSRAYVGDDEDLFTIASRVTSLLGNFIATPELAEDLRKVSKETFLDKDGARKAIGSLKDRLVQYCMTFETLYGYNPLRKEYLEKL